jgi:hypothetical protein
MMDSVAQYYSFKNRIINGIMSVWQRGTTFANPAVSGSFYTADRWGVNRAGDVTGATVSRSTSAPTGFQYSLALQRTAANASTAGLYLFYSSESSYTYDLAGQTVTLSFWAKVGANYSGGTLNTNAYGGTGTDQRVYAYTGSTTLLSYSPTLTTTWTQYSATFTVPSNITEMGLQFSWFPTGTAGADDAVYITGVQLEKGVTATSFDVRPYGTELALCQRYLPAFNSTGAVQTVGAGYISATTNANIVMAFMTQPRVAPTGITTTAASGFVFSATVGLTPSALTFNTGSLQCGSISAAITGGTAGHGGLFYASGSGAQILFTGCEL